MWSWGNGSLSLYIYPTCCKGLTDGPVRRIWLVFLLLLSGNVHPNPGRELAQLQTPDDFKGTNGFFI